MPLLTGLSFDRDHGSFGPVQLLGRGAMFRSCPQVGHLQRVAVHLRGGLKGRCRAEIDPTASERLRATQKEECLRVSKPPRQLLTIDSITPNSGSKGGQQAGWRFCALEICR